MNHLIMELVRRYPSLESCSEDIEKAFSVLSSTYKNGGKLLVCGNGGSASDADHIVGELMKGFKSMRPIDKSLADKIKAIDSMNGERLASALQNHWRPSHSTTTADSILPSSTMFLVGVNSFSPSRFSDMAKRAMLCWQFPLQETQKTSFLRPKLRNLWI